MDQDAQEVPVHPGLRRRDKFVTGGSFRPRVRSSPARVSFTVSPTAGLATALKTRSNCEVLAVPGTGEGVHHGMLARVMHRLAGDLGAPTGHPR